jgi:hypothetical protein
VCKSAPILDHEVKPAEPPIISAEDSAEPHPLLSHALASAFLRSVQRWIRQDSLGGDASEEFGEMRRLAFAMMTDDAPPKPVVF